MYEKYSVSVFDICLKMAIMLGFLNCFTGSSSKVAVEGAQKEADNINNGDHKEKSKSVSSAAIPVAYFPVGSNLSCL